MLTQGKHRNKIRNLIIVLFFTQFYERGKKTKMYTISGIVHLEASAAACQEISLQNYCPCLMRISENAISPLSWNPINKFNQCHIY